MVPAVASALITRIEAYACDDAPERGAQMARLAHFSPPSWSGHFELVEQLLESLA
jgi:hypothetical protein